MIDNRALSMLGNEISCCCCCSACFVGLLKKTQESEQEESEAVTKEREITERLHSRNRDGQTDRLAKDERDGGRTRESNMLEIKSDRTHRAKGRKKKRGIMGVSPFTLSHLDRYQPSGYSITPDPIFLKTVSLSCPRLCHSIFVPPSA